MESNMNEAKTKNPQTGLEIAVIGMAGRFPGANDIDAFRENLKNGVESVTFFTDEELLDAGINPGSAGNPNYVKTKGYVEDTCYFDSAFFDYPPNEAAIMDPQVRLFHECAWHALENAGYDPFSYPGLIGLYAGYNPNIFWKVVHLLQTGSVPEVFEIENLNSNFFTTLICYKLNLKGPGVSMNTACSTSLAAIHLACRALLIGEADIVLAGGVSVKLPPKSGYLYQEGMVMSSDGHCRPFDAKASGTAPGNGAGIVVLKRLVKAVKDRDHIYAVIKGTAINNDGSRKTGYTAPSVMAQAEVIQTALRMAGVESESITYIETHGTGTPLGDPIEIEALKKAFANTGKKKFCRLGFLKANIGHLDAAAGVAGFIKTVLALKHRLIPPALHFDSPNPEIDFENSPFYIDKNPGEWASEEFPLRAGVSSFGIGGTNAHVVLEEYSIAPGGLSFGKENKETDFYHVLLLSAKTQTALDKMTENLADYLKRNPGSELADVAYTLQVGRSAFNYRRMLVCTSQNDAAAGLLSAAPGKMRNYVTELDDRPVVFMFPGLGTQYVDMGAELYRREPVFRETMDRCFEILKNLGEEEIKEILYPSPGPPVSSNDEAKNQPAEMINRFEIAQVVIFIFEYALARLMMKWGIKPHSMIGYSFGEYIAACIAGVFSLEDALKLVISRGKLIRDIPAGAMSSVPIDKDTVKPFLNHRLSIAIDNGDSCIVAGAAADIDEFEKHMRERRYICIRLQASYPLHTPIMDTISKEFETRVGRLTLNKPQIPFISNVTGKWINPEDAVNPRYWATHLRETVRFSEGLKELMNIRNAVFLEVGPGVVLSTLAYQYKLKESNHCVVNLVRSPEQKIADVEYLMKKIGALWLYGTKIDWTGFYAGEKRNRVPLPLYPFDKLYYSVDLQVQNLISAVQEGGIQFAKQTHPPSTTPPTHIRPGQKTPYVAPRNKAEQLLARMWEEILGIRPIGIHDNLLEMGVTSLKGMTFVNRFKEQLGEIIHVTAVFDAPTTAELAAYFSTHYPESFAKVTGIRTIEEKSHPLPLTKEKVTIGKLMRFRRFSPVHPGPVGLDRPKNPPAVFILSPPRTGSTLLRVILGGHPLLFAPPELNLLSFNTLCERKTAFSGPSASNLQGTVRAVMEIKKCSVKEAQEIMETFENRGMTVKEFYHQVQEWLGHRLLVDKSPGYSNDLEILERAELYFQDPLYIHLMRHPYGMIHSFVEAKMDLLIGQQVTDLISLTRRELAEVIYTNSVYNTLDFLKQVPQERQLWIKFEDLAARPEDTAKDICRFLNLEFHPEMIQPYKEKKKRMTDGVYSEGQMIGDPKFHRHKDINAGVAENWKQHYTEDFLGEPTLEVSKILGYAPIHEPGEDIHKVDALPGNLVLLNGSPQAAENIFFVHERIGILGAYLEFCKQLGTRFNCWGIQPDKLKNYAPQNWTIEDTAAKYIGTIKKVQPQGPYYIFTWSFGGHIAFEMTRQMEQMGESLALLAFVDCTGPLGRPGEKIREFSLETEKNLSKTFFPSTDIRVKLDKITHIDHIWPFVVDLLQSGEFNLETMKPLFMELAEMHVIPNYSDISVEEIIGYINLNRTSKNAGAQYFPAGKIQTPIHYFRASESRGKNKEHWNDYCCTPVVYHEISGDHSSIFQQPQVVEFARLFNEVFENINKNER
jgi:acyl transferase domain-containing protein/thioesterase domain-containing protein